MRILKKIGELRFQVPPTEDFITNLRISKTVVIPEGFQKVRILVGFLPLSLRILICLK